MNLLFNSAINQQCPQRPFQVLAYTYRRRHSKDIRITDPQWDLDAVECPEDKPLVYQYANNTVLLTRPKPATEYGLLSNSLVGWKNVNVSNEVHDLEQNHVFLPSTVCMHPRYGKRIAWRGKVKQSNQSFFDKLAREKTRLKSRIAQTIATEYEKCATRIVVLMLPLFSRIARTSSTDF